MRRKSSGGYDLTEAEMEIEEDEKEQTRLEKLASKPCLLFCMYCGLIGYGVFGITFDWLWARDMLKTDSGLVFGPPRTVTLVFLFLIASVGTVAFVLEMVSFSLKVFKGKPLMDEDISQILTLFLEEVPGITLSLLLAQCREVPMSYYQLAKAALQMFGSGFRALRSIIRYFNKDKHRFKGFIPWLLRTVVFVACIYCCIAAILVWVFTYTSPPDEGGDFKPPGTIWEKSYDNGRYFYKSGVYLSHPSFAKCNNTVMWNETRVNWIKIDSITDILQAEDNFIDADFYFNATTNVIIVKNIDMVDQSDECYITDISDPSNCIITPFDCAPPDLDIYPMEVLSFRFQPQERTKTLVFGDIKFKSVISMVDGCFDVSVDEWGFLTSRGETWGQLQYLQMINKDLNDTYSYFEDEMNSGVFSHYQLDYELANVTEAWLTGWDLCPQTGSLSPNEDPDPDNIVPCIS